jgi:hypothetical protein
LGGVQVDVS